MTKYIGQQPVNGAYVKLDNITTSATNTYNLLNGGVAYSPQSALNCLVSLNGVIQSPNSAFTISGSQITFIPSSGTLSSDDVIDFIIVLGDVGQFNTVNDDAISTAKIQNDAITTDKINLISTGSAPSLEAKGDGSSQDGYIQLNCSQNSHGVKIKSPPHSAGQSYTLTLPQSITNNYFLKTDGSGNLSFADIPITDTTGIQNDISRLGLRVHAQGNVVGTNSDTISYDVFQDATKVENLTNAARHSQEYIQAGSLTAYTPDTADSLFLNNMTATLEGTHSAADGTVFTFTDNSSYDNDKDPDDTNGAWFVHTAGGSNNYALKQKFDLGGALYITEFYCKRRTTNGEVTSYKYEYSLNGTDWTLFDLSEATSTVHQRYSTNGANTSGGEISSMTAEGIVNFNVFGAVGGEYGMTYRVQNFTPIYARYIRQSVTYQNSGNSNAGIGLFIPIGNAVLTSTSGSFEGTAITASSSRSSVGAVINYDDNVGTNTINTDLILEVSADNGSNWSTATLVALPNFTGTTKSAKANGVSVAAGTQIKYKLSFANQNAGSKVAQIKGVSLQF